MKKNKFIWEEPQQKAYEKLKAEMLKALTLAHPDYYKEFILYIDASYIRLGFILIQIKEDKEEHPIAYEGRKLEPSERNYPITELECLEVVWGIRKIVNF